MAIQRNLAGEDALARPNAGLRDFRRQARRLEANSSLVDQALSKAPRIRIEVLLEPDARPQAARTVGKRDHALGDRCAFDTNNAATVEGVDGFAGK